VTFLESWRSGTFGATGLPSNEYSNKLKSHHGILVVLQ
jgi:hypothetical protein